MAKTIIMSLYKSSRWCKLLLLILIILIFFVGFSTYTKKEGFINQTNKFTFKEGPSIFDNFYSSIYDDIITDTVKDEYQVGEIINSTNPTNSSFILDIGSGTGDIVSIFNQKNIKAVGLDNSISMVNISKHKYPYLEFHKGDATNVMLYPAHTFTHITCLNDTIYYIKNKKHLIKNTYEWLMPGGYFILGLDSDFKHIKLTNKNKPIAIIATKCDKLSKNLRINNAKKIAQEFMVELDSVFFSSSKTGEGKEDIHRLIDEFYLKIR